MNKTYVTYNIALAMKELGFDEPCLGFYDSFNNNEAVSGLSDALNSAPTFQQAFDWFEDKHNIYVSRNIDTTVNEIADFTYYLKSWRFPPIEIEFEDVYDCFDRHKARIACLNKMIEIVKK